MRSILSHATRRAAVLFRSPVSNTRETEQFASESVQALEERVNLATVVISTDTTWSSDVNSGDDFVINNNATLTIASGVTVSVRTLAVGDGATDGFLEAQNATINTAILAFREADSVTYIGQNFRDNVINATVDVHAHNVDQLKNNDFGAGSVIRVGGVIDQDTQWSNFGDPDLPGLFVTGGVSVVNNAVLTIESGVVVNASGNQTLSVASNAFLEATGVTFNTTFLSFGGTAPTTTIATLFHGNTINSLVNIHAHNVNQLKNNDFGAGSQLRVSGTIVQDTTWENFGDPDLPVIHVVDDVRVNPFAKLTVESGVFVQEINRRRLLISSGGVLDATGADFNISITFDSTGPDASISENFRGNTVRNTINVHAHNVNQLRHNDFTNSAAIAASGNVTLDTVWSRFDDPDGRRIDIGFSFSIGNGATLTVAEGVTVNLDTRRIIAVGGATDAGHLVSFGGAFRSHLHFGAAGTGLLRGVSIEGTDIVWHAGADLQLLESSLTSDDSNVTTVGDPSATLDLRGNHWGTSNLSTIESRILHRADDPNRPLVLVDPLIDRGDLGGTVWDDANGNGIQDANEVGVQGVTVQLFESDNPITVVQSRTTALDGGYRFTALSSDDYFVRFIAPNGQTFTSPGRANRFLDSDVTRANGAGTTDVIDYSFTRPDMSIDAGLVDALPSNPDSIVGFANGNWWLTAADQAANYSTNLAGQWRNVTLLSTAVGDFNGDGRDDVAAHLSNGDIRVGITNADGTLTSSRWGGARTNDVKELHAADFDGDGQDDLILLFRRGSTNSANWWVYESQGNRFVADFYSRYGDWSGVTDVLVGNFDGVFGEDVATRNQAGTWWVGRAASNGTRFTNQAWLNDGPGAGRAFTQTGDFNGDGKLDLLTVHDVPGQPTKRDVQVYLSQGNGFTDTRWSRLTVTADLTSVVVGDFDGDGTDDMAALINERTWWQGTSSGSTFNLSAWTNWGFGDVAVDIQVGDSNGDGIDDIFGRNAASGTWWSAESTGSRFVNRDLATWSSSVNWQHVRVGQFTSA